MLVKNDIVQEYTWKYYNRRLNSLSYLLDPSGGCNSLWSIENSCWQDWYCISIFRESLVLVWFPSPYIQQLVGMWCHVFFTVAAAGCEQNIVCCSSIKQVAWKAHRMNGCIEASWVVMFFSKQPKVVQPIVLVCLCQWSPVLLAGC